MKQIKWGFLLLAIGATLSIMGIGISIGEESLLGAIISIIFLVFIMGLGFSIKKKMREKGDL